MRQSVKTSTKAVQGAAKVATASRNEAMKRLNDYFNFSATPEETAKLIRKAVFTLSELKLIEKDEPSTYDSQIYDIIFNLNDLAETLEPYFTKNS